MGACIGEPKTKKSKIAGQKKVKKQTKIQEQPRIITSPENKIVQQPPRPKYKKLTISQLLATYKIESTVDLSSKLEGPKYISSHVEGCGKIFRLLHIQNQVDQVRLGVFKRLLWFQLFENQEGDLMILDEYVCGYDIAEIMQEKKQNTKQKAVNFLKKVHKIITQFHQNKIWLGNLSISSFRTVSPFSDQVRLVDLNLNGQVTEIQKMGFAHKECFAADWEVFGYYLQFVVSPQPPIFIPHKLQYMDIDTVPYNTLIGACLKGKKCEQSQIQSLSADRILVSNVKMSIGYKFRRDINKLLKMRKKRKPHNRRLYGQNDVGTLISSNRFHEDLLYKIECQKIFQRIQTYIQQVSSEHQQAFMNYCGNSQKLGRLKEVFLLKDPSKKMIQLKQSLSVIK